MRQLCTALAALMLFTVPAQGQVTTEMESAAKADSLAKIAHDITALSVNTPIWLAQHLPAMMPQSGVGAGPGVGGDSGFTLGVILPRIGLFNQFNKVGEGTTMLGFEKSLPGNMIWPQLGVTAGLSVPGGFEVGADLQFIPETNMGSGSLEVGVSLLSVAGTLRWRISDSLGPIPSIVIGVGGSYYHGVMKLGAGYRSTYTLPYDTGTQLGTVDVDGTYAFTGSPTMSWDLFQVCPEVRLAWNLGPVKPYVGLGVGLTSGTVTGGAELTAEVSVDRVAGQESSVLPSQYTEQADLYTTEPARYTFRPHAGIDLVLGAIALTAQLDLAIMSNDRVNSDVSAAAGDFDPDQEGGLFGSASQDSQLSAAIVGTLAFRTQF